jgi:hypothetical protein
MNDATTLCDRHVGAFWSIDALADFLRADRFLEVARLRVQPGTRGRFPDGHLLVCKTEVAD